MNTNQSKNSESSNNITNSNDDLLSELDPTMKYLPLILELQKNKTSIFEFDPNVELSSNLDYPRSELGFHHFIHTNKNKTDVLKKFEGKKKVYLVLNKFEKSIDNYNESIGNVAKTYFSLEKENKPDILSDGFFKLWEILLLFDLIDTSSSFVSAHLAEKSGAFIQAVMLYRDMFGKKSKSDKYYSVTMKTDDTGDDLHIDDAFNDFYKKEKPQRILSHKYDKPLEEKADLITGYASFDKINENIQEQQSFKLLTTQIITATKMQKKGGSFVCKFFETFTRTSIKLVQILNELYDKVYFIKPLTSKESSSEKYAVCINFKYDDKDKEFKNITKVLHTFNENIHKNNEKIVDIFLNYEIPKNLIYSMIQINRMISNPQLKNIAEILTYVEKEIYSGDEYHARRDEQIECSKYWINLFYPTDINKNKKIYKTIVNNVTKKSSNVVKKLENKLVYVQSQGKIV
jgi:hypothetical protein